MNVLKKLLPSTAINRCVYKIGGGALVTALALIGTTSQSHAAVFNSQCAVGGIASRGGSISSKQAQRAISTIAMNHRGAGRNDVRVLNTKFNFRAYTYLTANPRWLAQGTQWHSIRSSRVVSGWSITQDGRTKFSADRFGFNHASQLTNLAGYHHPRGEHYLIQRNVGGLIRKNRNFEHRATMRRANKGGGLAPAARCTIGGRRIR